MKKLLVTIGILFFSLAINAYVFAAESRQSEPQKNLLVAMIDFFDGKTSNVQLREVLGV